MNVTSPCLKVLRDTGFPLDLQGSSCSHLLSLLVSLCCEEGLQGITTSMRPLLKVESEEGWEKDFIFLTPRKMKAESESLLGFIPCF